MSETLIGYARCSTDRQDLTAQRNRLRELGVAEKCIHIDHGYCTYDFYAQCPHSMACARCSFYVPKGSAKAQMIEGKANLSRMREEIPLTDEEVAAVDEGIELHDKLI